MRGIVISGGMIDDYEVLRKLFLADDIIICADSGYDHALKLGVTPHVVLGDFDSVKSSIKDGQNTIRYSTMKDATDTELAVDYAIDSGCREIVILGASGGRIDHEMANVFLLSKILHAGKSGCIFDGVSYIYIMDNHLELIGEPGDLFSAIPLTPWVRGITYIGLQYPLKNYDMEFGSSRGMSNVFCGKNVCVDISEGKLLIITTSM